MTVIPYGAAVSAVSMINKNRNESCNKKHNNEKEVKDIIIMYEDGSWRSVQNGIAVDTISEGADSTSCILDYANCTDDAFLSILSALIQIANAKGLVHITEET